MKEITLGGILGEDVVEGTQDVLGFTESPTMDIVIKSVTVIVSPLLVTVRTGGLHAETQVYLTDEVVTVEMEEVNVSVVDTEDIEDAEDSEDTGDNEDEDDEGRVNVNSASHADNVEAIAAAS